MPIQNREPDTHFKPYVNDNSLLIQFMMVEFVQTHQLISQFKNLKEAPSDQAGVDLASLNRLLNQLIGIHPQQQNSSFSRWTKGSLTKLKEFSEFFSHNSFYLNKLHLNLQSAVQDTWLAALHPQELVHSLIVNPYTQKNQALWDNSSLLQKLENLQKRFEKVERIFPKVMSAFKNNENVILCFFRYRLQLADIYGLDFLDKEFKWHLKSKKLMLLLLKRYQARGMETLLPKIQSIFTVE